MDAAKKYYQVAEHQYERAEKGEAEARQSEHQLERVKAEAEVYFSEASQRQQRLFSELEETKQSDASARLATSQAFERYVQIQGDAVSTNDKLACAERHITTLRQALVDQQKWTQESQETASEMRSFNQAFANKQWQEFNQYQSHYIWQRIG